MCLKPARGSFSSYAGGVPEPDPCFQTASAEPRRRRRNVVLTGFMGTGKTTVGRLLAARLGYEFVDTDAEIEQRHGPIPVIFAEHGEPTFRTIERRVAAEFGDRDGLVISTGGRMLLDPANEQVLSAHGDVFCLTASIDEIWRRVGRTATDRPLLAGADPRQRIVELLAERQARYARFPQVATDGRPPVEIVDEITDRIRSSDGRR
jgi:shikimate kinase